MYIFSGNELNPAWVSINLGGTCNSHCKFCYTEWTRKSRDMRTKEVKEVLERISDLATTAALVFTGGEPTIRRDLEELFEYARELGFQSISLQTHARELESMELLERLVARGLTSILLSLHGSNENMHDIITKSPGSFRQAITSLQNINKLKLLVTVNIVICQDNYKHLTEIIDLLDTILTTGKKIRFSYPIIEGAAFDNLEEVCVPFQKLQPQLLSSMQYAIRNHFEIECFGMPMCILGEFAHHTIYDNKGLSNFLSATVFNRDNIPRGEEYIKLQTCKLCAKIDDCPGIQVPYLRHFPDTYDVFIPLYACDE